MSVCKTIKEYKKLYNLFKRVELRHETILFTDSKGFCLEQVIPRDFEDKFRIIAKSGATVSWRRHTRDLLHRIRYLEQPIILVWLGTCEITDKRFKTVSLSKHRIYSH